MDRKREQTSDEDRVRIDELLSSRPDVLDRILRDINRIEPDREDRRPVDRVVRHGLDGGRK